MRLLGFTWWITRGSAGASAFVGELRKAIQSADECAREFVRMITGLANATRDSDWLPRLLRHVYGEEESRRLLARAATEQ